MAYDPNEPRNEHGEWSAAGGAGVGGHRDGPFMSINDAANAAKANTVAQIAASVATKLGYDPAKVNISDESKTFELNGKTLNYAGWATRPPGPSPTTNPDGSKQIIGGGTGTVTLFTPHVGDNPAGIAGVAAHEVSHQKVNAFFSDKETDYIKMQHDPDYHKDTQWVTYEPNNPAHAALKAAGAMVSTPQEDGTVKIREPGFMRPDGLLNEPYASKYPAYQAYTKAMEPGVDAFAKSDGVSSYSKEYWLGARTTVEKTYKTATGTEQSYKTYAINPELAFHETLAEIGRLKFSGEKIYHYKLGEVDGKPVYFARGKEGLNPNWSKLYQAVEKNWKRRSA